MKTKRPKSNAQHHFGLKAFDIPGKKKDESKLSFWWHQETKSTTTKTRDDQKRGLNFPHSKLRP